GCTWREGAGALRRALPAGLRRAAPARCRIDAAAEPPSPERRPAGPFPVDRAAGGRSGGTTGIGGRRGWLWPASAGTGLPATPALQGAVRPSSIGARHLEI